MLVKRRVSQIPAIDLQRDNLIDIQIAGGVSVKCGVVSGCLPGAPNGGGRKSSPRKEPADGRRSVWAFRANGLPRVNDWKDSQLDLLIQARLRRLAVRKIVSLWETSQPR